MKFALLLILIFYYKYYSKGTGSKSAIVPRNIYIYRNNNRQTFRLIHCFLLYSLPAVSTRYVIWILCSVFSSYDDWALSSTTFKYRVFSLMWPECMQIYYNRRKRLNNKKVQLPKDWFGTPTWPLFHCLGTPILPPWRENTLYYRVSSIRIMFLSFHSLRKQPTFRDATNGSPAKGRLTNERRNSTLMTRHYPEFQIWVVLLFGRGAKEICINQSEGTPRSG